jgi:hypothetical protein
LKRRRLRCVDENRRGAPFGEAQRRIAAPAAELRDALALKTAGAMLYRRADMFVEPAVAFDVMFRNAPRGRSGLDPRVPVPVPDCDLVVATRWGEDAIDRPSDRDVGALDR